MKVTVPVGMPQCHSTSAALCLKPSIRKQREITHNFNYKAAKMTIPNPPAHQTPTESTRAILSPQVASVRTHTSSAATTPPRATAAELLMRTQQRIDDGNP